MGQPIEVLSTGEVNVKLGPGPIVSADFVKSLGVKPYPHKGSGTYWRASDFPAICEALVGHILGKM